jgi:hypothetical protein
VCAEREAAEVLIHRPLRTAFGERPKLVSLVDTRASLESSVLSRPKSRGVCVDVSLFLRMV